MMASTNYNIIKPKYEDLVFDVTLCGIKGHVNLTGGLTKEQFEQRQKETEILQKERGFFWQLPNGKLCIPSMNIL